MRLLSIFLFFISLSNVFCQKVYWADKLVDTSSEYGEENYSGHQALGVPNGFYDKGLEYMAWAPAKQSSNTGEYIHVSFKKAIQVQQVAVFEINSPGAIKKIWLYDLDGKKHEIFENKSPGGSDSYNEVFRKKIPKTSYRVKALKIELSTKDVSGMNQIDAIAISDSKTDIIPQVNNINYDVSKIGEPERLGAGVNSNFAERMPLITPDGQTLYFARKLHPQNIGDEGKDDIWVSYLQNDEQWSRAINMGAPLNNEKHNFVVAINPSGNSLYVANDYSGGKKDALSITRKVGRTWMEPKRLNIKNHYNDSKFVNYHVSNDGNVLVMAVKREDTFGDRDLYVSFKVRGNEWTEPRNLGSDINTVNTENSVFLSSDNKTIYFSSNGHPGYGGYDIFMSKREDNTWQNWSRPKNLGKAINSTLNDLSFSIPASGDYAYFSAGQIANTDLFRIRLPEEAKPEPVKLMAAKFIDAETKKPVIARVVFEKLNGDVDGQLEQTMGKDAKFVIPQGENISFYAEAEGYFPVSDHVNNSSAIEGLDQDTDAYSTNQELRVLQNQLESIQGELRDLNRESRRTNLITAKREKEKSERIEKYFKDVIDEEQEQTVEGDNEELNALMKKYNIHYGKETASTTKKKSSGAKTRKKTKNSSTSAKSDDEMSEVERMKSKLNKHYDKKETERERIATKETGAKKKKEEELTVEVIESVREDLIKELMPQLKIALYEEYYEEIKKEVERDLQVEMKKQDMALVEEKVKKKIIENWEEEIDEEISAEEKDEMETDLYFQMQDEMEEELKEEMGDEIKEELKRETKIAIKEDMEQELKEKIESQEVNGGRQVMQEEEEELDPAYEEIDKEISFVALKVGAIIPMNNIFFDANEANLKVESFAELDRLVNFLFDNDKLVVEIGGHTNGWCSSEFAHELSTDRAKQVEDYLVENGIHEDRLKHKGYGKTKPIASNDSLKGRKKNQRVELKILEIID